MQLFDGGDGALTGSRKVVAAIQIDGVALRLREDGILCG